MSVYPRNYKPLVRRKTKYNFWEMTIYDSRFFADYGEGVKAYNSARGVANRNGWRVVCRKDGDGLRIWRIS